MKIKKTCMFCETEDFEECEIKVEGKLYGIVTKSNKEKHKIKAITCKNCGMILLKQING